MSGELAGQIAAAGYQPVFCTQNAAGAWTPLGGTTGGAAFPIHTPPPAEPYRLALRPPPYVLIVDVDRHEGSTIDGWATIQKAEAELGQLPPTWRLTARGPGQPSGRYLYRIPPDLVVRDAFFDAYGQPDAAGRLKGAVDAVRTGHRFSWAPGDINPHTGTPVICYGPDGLPSALPQVDQLPTLPDTWLQAMYAHQATQAQAPTGPVAGGLAADFMANRRPHTPESAHDTVRAALLRIREYDTAGAGFRDVLLKASKLIGGFVPALFSSEQAEAYLYDAVRAVWHNEPDADDVQMITSGIRLGSSMPFTVLEGYYSPEQPQGLSAAPAALPSSGAGPEDDPYWEPSVEAERRRLAIREEAARRHRTGTAPDTSPGSVSLSELMAEPEDAVRWRVNRLWPADGRVMLHAQFKAGKTTLFGNLLRSLADGEPFLGHDTTPVAPGETAMLLDFELSRNNLRRWLRDHRIVNTGSVQVETLRGQASRFAITDTQVRQKWAAHLLEHRVTVLLIDPLAPLLSALGVDESSNSEVGPFLAALDTLAEESGVREVIVAHHAGHNGERSRGASRLRDWPDAEWSLVREEEVGLTEAKRYFSAIGRDVAQGESELVYDFQTRRLDISGGSRASNSVETARTRILEALGTRPGLGVRDLEAKVRGRKGSVKEALDQLIDQGFVEVQPQGQKLAHYLRVPASPPVPIRNGEVSPTPLGGDTPNPVIPKVTPGDGGRGQLSNSVSESLALSPPPRPSTEVTVSGPEGDATAPPAAEPPAKAEAQKATKAELKAQERQARISELAGPDVTYPVVVTRRPRSLDNPDGRPQVTEVSRDDAATLLKLATVTVDVETSGYPLGHQLYGLRLCQLGNEHYGVVLDPADPGQRSLITDTLEQAERLHAHNATADLVPLADAGLGDFDAMWAKMDDTVIAAKLNDPASTGADPGLKQIADHLLGEDSATTPADEARKQLFSAMGAVVKPKVTDPPAKNGWYSVNRHSATFAAYAGSDVIDCATVAQRLPALPDWLAHRERTVAHMVSRVALDGVPLDGDVVRRLHTEHSTARTAATATIRDCYGIQNPGSSKQVSEALQGRGVELPRTKPSKTHPEGQLSVAGGVLEALSETYPAGTTEGDAVRDVLTWRHHDTALKLFLEPYKVMLDHGDGRARTTIYTLGADTGRMSSTRFNFQQLPKTGGFRAVMTTDPGMLQIGADFSSVEIRVAAEVSGDQVLLRMLDEGLDPHAMAAELVFGPGWTKEQRYKVKAGVFGRIYGGGLNTLATQMGVPHYIAQRLIDAIDTLWPTLSQWSDGIKRAVESGLLTTWTSYSGRIIHLPRNKAHAAPNYVIQGTARELLMDALLRWKTTPWGNCVLWPVHDEIDVHVPAGQAEDATAELVRCMEVTLPSGVRIIAEPAKPSPSWQDAA